jgi:hypothetical protein
MAKTKKELLEDIKLLKEQLEEALTPPDQDLKIDVKDFSNVSPIGDALDFVIEYCKGANTLTEKGILKEKLKSVCVEAKKGL